MRVAPGIFDSRRGKKRAGRLLARDAQSLTMSRGVATMKVAVTGGSGKIGRDVVRQLRERGHQVLSLDIVPPIDPSLPHQVLDLRAPSAVRRAFDGQDAVCHLGEWPQVYIGPAETYANNSEIGSTVMAVARQVGVGRLIYTSTCQVYGYWGGKLERQPAPLVFPVDETMPLRANNAYALAKISNESFARLMVDGGQMPIAAFRFPFVIGKNQIDFTRRRNIDSDKRLPEGFGTYLQIEDAALAYCLALEKGWEGFEAFHFVADDLLYGYDLKSALLEQWPDITLPTDWNEASHPVSTAKARRAARLGPLALPPRAVHGRI